MASFGSISSGDIAFDFSKLANFEGYKAQTTYNVQDNSSRYMMFGIFAIVLVFLFKRK
jgi:hypothetical protein